MPKKKPTLPSPRLLDQAYARLHALASIPAWRSQVHHLHLRMTRIGRLLASRHYGHPDDFFFSFDELPAFGKEYWFLHFVVPGSKEQVVLTFGRAVGSVQVNKTDVPAAARPSVHSAAALLRHPKPLGQAPLQMRCAAVCWLYGQKKEVLIDSQADVRLDLNGRLRRLSASSQKNTVLIEGAYPRYRAHLTHRGRTVFAARISPSDARPPYEFIHLMRSPILKGFGADMVNYYFKFAGRVQNRAAQGTAYLQKVLAVLPLTPWNWVRIQFANGAVLDFFAAKPFSGPAEFQLASNAYFQWKGGRIRLHNLRLRAVGARGARRRWILSGPHLQLTMRAYALQPFAMKTATAFQYDEYLVQAQDFSLSSGGKTYSLSDTGQGSGIVEEATGYLL